MTGPTVLLTGGTGVVGTALRHELANDPVIALTHHKPIESRALRGDVTRPWLGLTPDDYRDLAGEVDVVVHCAASVNFTATPEVLYNLNVRGVGHLLRFVEDANARLVHASTAFVERAGDGAVFDDYAESKTAGETLVRESGLPASIARISTVIGDSHTGQISRLQSFHYFLGLALSGQLPFLPCEQGTHVDLIPQDVAAAALAALARADTATTTSDIAEYWITAGDAAPPITKIIDLGYDAGARRIRRNESTRDVDPSIFRTRLVDPATGEHIIDTVLSHTKANAAPSMIHRAARLMAAYHSAGTFPTSLGHIADGPPSVTPAALEKALTRHLEYLVELPTETWDLD